MGTKRKRQQLQERDQIARAEYQSGVIKKTFHPQDLKFIRPKTKTQEDLFQAFHQANLFLYGSAGTGKTFLSMYLALREVLEGKFRRLIIIRSVVPSRDTGFLPGTLEEKIAVYEQPYRTICNQLFPYSKSYDNLKKGGYIEFMTTSFLRGDTLDDCIVLVDEIQNMNFQEADTIITRFGENTKIIFSGDTSQTDLNKKYDKSGMIEFMRIIEGMDEFEMVRFVPQDVVRSGLVRSYLLRKEALSL